MITIVTCWKENYVKDIKPQLRHKILEENVSKVKEAASCNVCAL
jgi:hypothetical protein